MPQKKIQKPTKCYHCGREIRDSRDLVEKKIPLHTRSGIRMYRRKFHINCIPKYFENLDTESETMQEQSDWIKCYELFRKLLGIKEDSKLPKSSRIKGRFELPLLVASKPSLLFISSKYTFSC